MQKMSAYAGLVFDEVYVCDMMLREQLKPPLPPLPPLLQAHALSALVKAELTHKVGSIEQWQAWDAACSRLDDLPL